MYIMFLLKCAIVNYIESCNLTPDFLKSNHATSFGILAHDIIGSALSTLIKKYLDPSHVRWNIRTLLRTNNIWQLQTENILFVKGEPSKKMTFLADMSAKKM